MATERFQTTQINPNVNEPVFLMRVRWFHVAL